MADSRLAHWTNPSASALASPPAPCPRAWGMPWACVGTRGPRWACKRHVWALVGISGHWWALVGVGWACRGPGPTKAGHVPCMALARLCPQPLRTARTELLRGCFIFLLAPSADSSADGKSSAAGYYTSTSQRWLTCGAAYFSTATATFLARGLRCKRPTGIYTF